MTSHEQSDEGRLMPAMDGAWLPTVEGVVEMSPPADQGMLLLHICGPGALMAGPSGAAGAFLRILPGPTGWPCLLACIDVSAARDTLLLMLDAPEPEPGMRRQLTRDVNRGVTLPGIVFGTSVRDLPRWIGQFAAQLAERGYRVCTVYLGPPDAPPPAGSDE